jgi:hypothetical protein
MKKTLHVFAIACISLLTLPAAAQVPAYVPTDGLVGWWPFNGNANDESGNGNDGTVNGAMLSSDRFGNVSSSYYFNNSDITVQIPNTLFASDFTIASWVKLDEYIGLVPDAYYYPTFIAEQNDALIMQIELHQAIEKFNCYFMVNPGIGGQQLEDGHVQATQEVNTWTHVVLVNSGGINSLYINGILIDVAIAPSTLQGQEPGSYLKFGNGDFLPTISFNGLLDDIGIYNRALSEQEIQSLYTGTTPPPCVSLPSNLQQGLVGYWPFCGNANDESGNGNDGTVNGATLTEDRFGNAGAAFSFNGNSSNIVVQNSQSLNPTEISINAWIKPLADNLCIVKKSNAGNASEYGYGLTHNDYFFYQRGMKSQFGSGDCWTINDNDAYWSDPNIVQNNVWSMITTSIDSNGQVRQYANGILIFTTQTTALFSCNSPTSTLRFGGPHWNGDPEWFWGDVDDIGIWNRALTPEEVQELYTLDACTFTVYDTSYVTVYDTLTTYETVYDTLYTYETIYDTITTNVTVTDTLLIDITFTGFEGQPSWLNTVTVFPNPASDHITIDYGNFALMAGFNTVITDAAGATVYSSAVNSQQAYIDINAWGAAGVYYMTIYDASGAAVAVRHIVLQ